MLLVFIVNISLGWKIFEQAFNCCWLQAAASLILAFASTAVLSVTMLLVEGAGS
jgi:hypothetical protein